MEFTHDCLFILSCSVVASLMPVQGTRNSAEKELVRDLLTRYELEGKLGRPVARATDTILVNFSISLVQILDVDEKNQVLKTNIWYHYKWTDVLLQWNPSHRGNITSIRLPSDSIWLPDIRLYNFADDRLTEKREALVVVRHTGDLLWMPQAILNSSCTFDILSFPFDHQMCHLKFGSWTYNGDMLNIDFMGDQKQLDLAQYIQSSEWEIIDNIGRRNVKYYSCCPEPFPDVTFTVKLKRKIVFYTFILILPCGLLSLLTMVIFWVPPESSAKLQLGMNIFLAFLVLLLVLADLTPTSATFIPLIGAFYCLSMVMISLSTVLACVIANMYFRGVRVNRAPTWLRQCVLDSAARILNVDEVLRERRAQKLTTPRKIWSSYVTSAGSQSDPETLVTKVLLLDRQNLSRRDFEDYGTFQDVTSDCKSKPSRSTPNHSSVNSSSSATSSEVTTLAEEVTCIRELMDEDIAWRQSLEESHQHVREWRMIACVMDRIFFFFYVVVNVVGLSSIVLRSYFP